MEKVTFPPLIALLKENAEAFNQILHSTGAVSRRLRTADIPAWFTEVIEPVFKAVYRHDQTRSRKLFDVLYRDMLAVLASSVTNLEFELAKSCRLLIALNPAVTAISPSRTLAALTMALQKISRHSQKASCSWLALMERIVPLAKDSNELLSLGRIAAWRCGMAHLRGMVDISAEVDPRIIAIIFPDEDCAPEQLKRRWNSDKVPTSLAAGGFCGLGGTFSRPPRVAVNKDLVFVSDGSTTNALFADRFGHTLHDCADAFSEALTFELSPVKAAAPAVAKILARYSDLTSWAHHDSTL
ncbi:MAG: hypothetical protein KKB51_10450, partial [Candidatus Riflebacteria bacterium]|nr:hypothetical protein [Candidatus Riflebacteria bacterium]